MRKNIAQPKCMLSIAVPPEVRDKLVDIAEKDNRTVTSLVNYILKKELTADNASTHEA